MFNAMLRSPHVVPGKILMLRDILIDFLKDVQAGVQNKEEVDKIIKKASVSDFTPETALEIIENIRQLSVKSYTDTSLRYNGMLFPTQPFGRTLERTKELLKGGNK